jgi:peptidylprolyl isomerase
MFTKFELLGITASICAMILALYLVTLETNVFSSISNTNQVATVNESRLVVSGTDQNAQNELRSALTNAAGPTGRLEKLVVNDVRFGVGEAVKIGDTVTVHYVGTLQNGFEFDNSKKRSAPFTFTVGEGQVIKGWEEGIVGMKVGGARILVIPPALGYGTAGFGPIPPDAPLVFSIELLSIN